MRRNLRKFNNFAVTCALIATALAWGACDDIEVADHNPEFRAVPTVERAPTVQTAPTVETAPTVAKFEGFKEAPTATKFEGFTEDENPCTTFLEQPSPQNAERAAEWATGHLDGAGGQIDPNDNLRVTATCEAVLKNRK